MLSSPTLLVVGYILKLLPASALFVCPVKDFQVEIKCRSTFAWDACCLLRRCCSDLQHDSGKRGLCVLDGLCQCADEGVR